MTTTAVLPAWRKAGPGMMGLGVVGEFGLIRRIRSRTASVRPPVIVGIGDDAAAIRPTPGRLLLITTDTLIEHVDFERQWAPFEAVGYRAVAAATSDIAAMGGRARYYLTALGLPRNMQVRDVDALYRGMRRIGRQAGLTLLGGDLSVSRSGLVLTVTVLGEASPARVVTRAGARAGDLLYVTGTLGDAAAGLALLTAGRGATQPGARHLIRRHLYPRPRLREGALLAAHRLASAMIDLSDGLASDLRRLCEESGIGAEVMTEQIPMLPAVRRQAARLRRDPLRWALTGGEDYELLFTVRPADEARLLRLARAARLSMTRIGRMTATAGGRLIDRHGRRRPLAGRGYEHFSAAGGRR